jgi:Ribonuclease G/E
LNSAFIRAWIDQGVPGGNTHKGKNQFSRQRKPELVWVRLQLPSPTCGGEGRVRNDPAFLLSYPMHTGGVPENSNCPQHPSLGKQVAVAFIEFSSL